MYLKKMCKKDQLIFGIWLQIDKIIPCDVFFLYVSCLHIVLKCRKKSVTFKVEKEETTYE